MSTTKVTIVSSHLGVKAEPSEVSIIEGDTIVFLCRDWRSDRVYRRHSGAALTLT